MIDDRRVISQQLALFLTGTAVFVVACHVLIFTFSGILPDHYNPVGQWTVYVIGLILVPGSMFLATKFPFAKFIAITSLHLMACVELLYFSEIFSPFTPLWSILVLLSSIYFGWRGFAGSLFTLVIVGIAYCLLFFDDLEPNFILYAQQSLIIILLTSLMSFLFVRIIMNGHIKNTELLAAQQSEQLQINRLNTLLNSISDAVLTLNRYGRVTSQNAAAQVFFDTNQSLVGHDIDKILDVRDTSNESFSTRNLIEQTKTTILRDDLLTGQDGDMRHLSMQMSRIRSTFDDSEDYGVVVIIRDITKQKSLEQEKDEFISVTSHELRTPVTIAEGSLSNLLVMEERNTDKSKLRDAAKMAYQQVLYLAKMVNDLSTLSRAERGVGSVTEAINVNELLHDLYAKYMPEAQTKSLALDLDAEAHLPKIETSRLYLEEILENFLTNAIKYTKAGTITLGAQMESDDKIKLWVKDSGIGMSKADVEHIFEKFYRSEDYRTRETSGTGLGLYVVSKLAAKLETKIDVESRLNYGSTFSFKVSLHPQNATKLAGPGIKSARSATKNESASVI